MNEDNIFDQTKGAYLCLIHPNLCGDIYRQEIAPVIALASSVPDDLVVAMITGTDWRERLLSLCFAMAKHSSTFIDAMLQSLLDPKGIAIVPVCATLTVLAKHRLFTMTESFSVMFERTAFDGEVGWATDKAMHATRLRAEDVPGRGPNYGQIFEDHLVVYSWIYDVGVNLTQ